jgi:hypothetical protein
VGRLLNHCRTTNSQVHALKRSPHSQPSVPAGQLSNQSRPTSSHAPLRSHPQLTVRAAQSSRQYSTVSWHVHVHQESQFRQLMVVGALLANHHRCCCLASCMSVPNRPTAHAWATGVQVRPPQSGRCCDYARARRRTRPKPSYSTSPGNRRNVRWRANHRSLW